MSQAKQILEKIISNFSAGGFSRFFREKSRQFAAREENYSRYNDDDFKNGLKLGEVNFSDSDSLIICAFEVKKELSERAGKKAQYEKAKNILKSAENQKFSAGIFIFSDTGGNFRFSLVYPESIGARRQWSNFRRFTYFVSREFTNKTFLQRIGDGDFESLEKIKDAFSVEKVTKEFYLEYRKLFENLLVELSKNHTFLNEAAKAGLNAENFAKKLLGQIVFLYFIQKKGWLGVPESAKWGQGDKNFLSNLFKQAKNNKKNFYNNYLEKLFYNALNNPRRDSVDPSFSKDFNCRIPFLNGGLFEAEYNWKDSFIYFDDKIFQAIFEVFDRYNFTVEEESPDDKEIAVDPEMLGKVFENLLAEHLRKGKGTYYTPREIVYYMCRESLTNYLIAASNLPAKKIRKYIDYADTDFADLDKKWQAESFKQGQFKKIDDLLANIKIVDPACGSGAFLVGMLNLIVKLRIFLQLTPDSELYLDPSENTIKQKSEYELKKETIQNCIYGVDIDPGAIEIAKLRLWLQLVVDYELKDIEPLPNLDYRLMCGNSLLEEFEGVKFYNGEETEQQGILLIDTKKQEKVAELKKKVKEYFNIHDDKEKQAKRKDINDIKDWLVRSALEKRKQTLFNEIKLQEQQAKLYQLDDAKKKQHLLKWADEFSSEAKIKKVLDNLHNPKKTKPFFIWKLEFIDVFEDKGGFDIVIANPPYIRHRDLDKNLKDTLKNAYKTGNTTSDIYCYFYELSYNLLCKEGVSSFITSNKWMRAKYGQNLRVFFKENTAILQIIDLGSGQFASATVDTNILIFEKQTPSQDHQIEYEFKTPTSDQQNLFKISQKRLEDDSFILTDPTNLRLKVKIERAGVPLSQWSHLKINYGVLTGKNEIKTQNGKEGVFIIDKKTRDDLISRDSSSSLIIHPVLRGRDVSRYLVKWSDKYIIAMYYGSHHVIDEFPAIKDHLYKYRESLESRAQVIRGDHHWLELDQNPSKKYIEEFEQPKIVYPVISSGASFTYDDSGYFHNDKVFHIVGENLKFLLGFLNSKLAYWLIQHYGPGLGDTGFEFRKIFVEKLPIPEISDEVQKPFVEIVDKILAITKDDDYLQNPAKQEQVKKYEKQIDEMVYGLYGLTKEEIKIVEKNLK